jgi:hypothetical protein
MHCIQTHSLVVCSWLWVVEVFFDYNVKTFFRSLMPQDIGNIPRVENFATLPKSLRIENNTIVYTKKKIKHPLIY